MSLDLTSNHAVLLVDVMNDFHHEDGTALATSFRERLPALEALVESSRRAGTPIVYVNDALGEVRCCRESVVKTARAGLLGSRLSGIMPRNEDVFLVKPLYSGFEQTGLEAALRRLGVDTVIAAGAATERCVAETVTSARERSFAALVVADACATVDPRLESIALEYLEAVAGATIVSTAEVCRSEGRAPVAPISSVA